MPELFEILHGTRAMRRLKPDPVPDELIRKILEAGASAANGGNFQRWRFLVIKDREIKKAVKVHYKRAFDEIIGPRYKQSAPPPGSSPEKYHRQHDAVEYLTEHFDEAPVWIVACLAEGDAPTRMSGASIYPAVQNMLLAARGLGLGSTLTTRHLFFEEESERARSACRPGRVPTPSCRSAGRWAISARSAAGRWRKSSISTAGASAGTRWARPRTTGNRRDDYDSRTQQLDQCAEGDVGGRRGRRRL